MAERRYALASKLFGSGVIAQACGFVAIAFAASRTLPEDFAIFALVTAATAVLGSVNSLAAESRVPVVGQRAAEALNRAGFTAIVAFSAVCLAVGAAGMALGEVWGQVAMLTSWCSFMLGLQHLLVGIVLRTQQQVLLARNRLVQGISNAALIVGFILLGIPGSLSLSLAWALSLLGSNLVLLPRVKGWGPGFRLARREDFTRLLDQVRWQPVSNVLSDGVGQIPLLVLPALGAPAVSGAWALASRFLTPVVNMAQITLQPIYYGRAAALLRERDVEGFQTHRRRWSRALALCGIPVLLGCVVCLEWLIPLFGPEWSIAGLVLLPACLVFPMALSWLPISQTLILTGHLRSQFLWTVAQFTLSAAVFAMVPLGLWQAQDALLAWAVVSAGSMLVHRLMQRRAPLLDRLAADVMESAEPAAPSPQEAGTDAAQQRGATGREPGRG